MKNLHLYNVLREPHISEKVSILGEESNQYAFKVAMEATRPQIKEAVEEIFKVAVKKVTTTNVKLTIVILTFFKFVYLNISSW